MSLNKCFLLLAMLLVSGCQGLNSKNDDYFIIKVNTSFNDRTLQKLEQVMILEMPLGFTDVTIFTGDSEQSSAFQLKEYFLKTYGIITQVYLTPEKDELYIQFRKHSKADCYYYELNDFNWYKSNTQDIERFSNAEICATNINDHALKAQ